MAIQTLLMVSVNIRFWHKATIQLSGTFHESGGAIDLQHLVKAGCNEVVN